MNHRAPGVVVAALVLASCGLPPQGRPREARAERASIAWEPWSHTAFERARREGRMVLVDVGIEGCTACRWMYEDTYRHPEVVRRVNRHFVPIAVDADVRPDVGERYERWGWPATIVLTPDGTQVLALRGNRRPRSFLPILDEIIRRHEAGTLVSEAEQPIEAPAAVDDLDRTCSAAALRIAAIAGAGGGFGGGMRHALGEPVRWELARGRAYGERARTDHALATLEGYAGMIDPVWGGIFVAASADFSSPIPEKRTIHQGPMLAAFAEAYHATGDARWVDAVSSIDRYLRAWMQAENGTFFATQEDRAPDLPSGMSARDYYALADAERRRHGVPPIDHAVYTDLNALVIEGYVRAYEATGDREHLDIASRAADVLVRARQQREGWIAQTAPAVPVSRDHRMREFAPETRAFLRPQGPFGLALLALFSATGEPRWLEAAGALATGLARLEDPERGGFFASDETDTDGVLGRRKPLAENLAAARFLVRLSWATHDEAHRARAERALRAVLPAARVERMGSGASLVARTLEELSYGAVDVTVLGTSDDAGARALFTAAVRAWEPRKVLRYDAPGGRYPDLGRPALFACTDVACSSPVFDPAEVSETVARIGRVDEPAPCAAPDLD